MDYDYNGELSTTTDTLDSLFFPNYQHRSSDASSSCTDENALFRSQWNTGMGSYHQPDMECEESNQPERGIAGFVSKLYQCLQAADDGQKYARWCKHNGIDMFIIDCIPKFTEVVLPRLFKHCKFASFVRQLNIYGFQRDTDARKSKDSKDKETCRWYHIHFRSNRRDLFHLIRRKTPRYSRRKRSKVEEDPETILPICSGEDESDNGEEEASQDDEGGRRWSSSSVSSSSVTLQPVTDYKPQQPLQMVFEKTSPQLNMAQQYMHQPLHQQQQQQQSQILARMPSSSEESSYARNLEESEAEIELASESRHPHDLAMHQTMTQEDQLRSQIDDLRREYLKMYKTLTGQVNKASSLINVQRSRIEFLETSLHNVKLKEHPAHHPGFIDTNPFPLDYIIEQSTVGTETPTTPLYPTSSTSSCNRIHTTFLANNSAYSPRMGQPGYNVFLSPSVEDDLRLASPCSNDKSMWLSTTFQGESMMTNETSLENTSRFDQNNYAQQVESPSKPNPFFGCDLSEAIQ